MTDRLDPKFQADGPSAAYAFERNRLTHLGASPEAAHEAGLRAQNASVWGSDAQKDRNGKFIPQGIGAPGHETGNHFAALKKAEQMGLERPGAYEKALREIWKRGPEWCKAVNLEQPARLGE